MIYTFKDSSKKLEVSQSDYTGSKVVLNIENQNGGSQNYALNKNQLYDLIGALHSIQTKIKKGGSNV